MVRHQWSAVALWRSRGASLTGCTACSGLRKTTGRPLPGRDQEPRWRVEVCPRPDVAAGRARVAGARASEAGEDYSVSARGPRILWNGTKITSCFLPSVVLEDTSRSREAISVCWWRRARGVKERWQAAALQSELATASWRRCGVRELAPALKALAAWH
jgi:hypothetical protein